MPDYSYVKKDGSFGTVSGPDWQTAIKNAVDADPHSGVVTPPFGSNKGSTPSPYVNNPPTTRTGPTPRIDPNSFNTPSFGNYRESSELTSGELANISSRYTDQLQREMDLINAQYGQRRAGQEELNRGEIARARVLNANTGIVDSGTGATAEGKVRTKAQAALDALDAERTAKLSSTVGQIDSLKQQAIEAETARKRQDLVNYGNMRTENAKKAEEILKTYIENGGDLEKLKSDKKNPSDPTEPNSYDALANALGGAGVLESLALGYAPKDTYVSDKPEIIGNKAIFFKKSKDGTISQSSIDLPISAGGKIKSVSRVPGDGLYVFYEDGTYKRIGTSGTDSGSGSGSGDTNLDVPSWDDYLKAAEELGQQNYSPESQAKLREQYDATYGQYQGSSTVKKFTAAEQKKLEQAGLLGASRQEQLNYLYGKKNSAGTITNPFQ